ncbi:hypothetical protein [Beijerinckia sp. L45]|uniref:hypothetical protein n=1 Tax=Beijerinckia sp. L45 TaxID=1641855 RepID=UPI00131CC44C|nr:hypothetical protein [Beijerinckia sp. L45]
MALPKPAPGLVIRYSYLWYHEHRDGREDGRKDRPCAIVAAIHKDAFGDTRVLVLPVTHAPPGDDSAAIEIPAIIKERLRLDDARSWIVLSEWNDFVWPGPDLRRIPNMDDGSVAYGFLPPAFFATIRDRFLALAKQGGSKPISRT